ncbi:hypothetical protein N7335_01905 [Stutzerimonas stutzeri]|uniref:Uncharacterized protein n=1 Tax=Stutzerimonas stutzeri TaxID=316 RepID=A0AA42H6K1_STUST|nr:hypothetical protein [Stutzerimonas stutzeri]MDH0145140.1 hypothetical protein [Stutzerimonas stutzeri]MDH0149605.1 hypothetical protein [Stutzerimonas stutzeri]
MSGYLKLSDMSQAQRDEYLIYAAAMVVREAGVDMPDEVAAEFFFWSESRAGYEYGLLDTVFNCLAYILRTRRMDDDVIMAFAEMLEVDANPDVTAGVVLELATFAMKVEDGLVPKLQKKDIQ